MMALLLALCKNKMNILCHPQFIRLGYPLLLQIIDIFSTHEKVDGKFFFNKSHTRSTSASVMVE